MTTTTDKDALIELAKRCEAATGPDRELDGAIDRLFHRRPVNGDYDEDEGCIWRECDGYSGLCVRSDGFARNSFCAKDYTASLDAAMTLVPEGFDWIIGRTNGGLTIHAEVGGRGDEFQRFGETPALALCAAALRARAS